MTRRTGDLTLGARPVDPKLFATLERAELDQSLAGIQLTGGPGAATAVLAQDPAALDAISLALARLAHTLLPLWRVDPLQAATLQRQIMPALPTFAANVSSALRLLGRGGVTFPVSADPLDELMKKRGAFAGFRLLGMQVTNIGLDQRQISGAFLVFLIERAVGAIDRRFNEPKTTQAAKDKLLADFGSALLTLDEVLRTPQLRKEQLGAQREALAEQAEDAEAEAQLAEASMRLRQKLVVPREVLFSAARRFVQKQQEAGPAGPAPARPPGAPGTPGKIIR
jgi:hypothetical protein